MFVLKSIKLIHFESLLSVFVSLQFLITELGPVSDSSHSFCIRPLPFPLLRKKTFWAQWTPSFLLFRSHFVAIPKHKLLSLVLFFLFFGDSNFCFEFQVFISLSSAAIKLVNKKPAVLLTKHNIRWFWHQSAFWEADFKDYLCFWNPFWSVLQQSNCQICWKSSPVLHSCKMKSPLWIWFTQNHLQY